MMRLVPRRGRFAAALLIARVITPVIRRTDAYRGLRTVWKVDGAAEIALYYVLHVMTKYDAIFDPVLEVDNYGALGDALAEGNGVLILAPHTMLLYLLFRHFHDEGLEPVGLSTAPATRLVGTAVEANTLQPSATILLSVRNLLRRGRLVCGMPDRGDSRQGRTIEFETHNGRKILDPALMKVAVRAGARVLFTEVHVSRSRVFATVVAPSSRTADGLAEEFMEFVRKHVGLRGAH
jgi:lauroyl/myristoyl acyltransferase